MESKLELLKKQREEVLTESNELQNKQSENSKKYSDLTNEIYLQDAKENLLGNYFISYSVEDGNRIKNFFHVKEVLSVCEHGHVSAVIECYAKKTCKFSGGNVIHASIGVEWTYRVDEKCSKSDFEKIKKEFLESLS